MSRGGGNKLIVFGVVAFIVIIVGAISASNLVETVDKGTYQIRQWPVTGALDAKMTTGMWWQCFSDIETWPKAETFYFTADVEEGAERDQSIEVRFNEGSLCRLSGSCRVMLPITEEKAIALVNNHGYRSYETLSHELIMKVVRNSLRLTANLMSARESYAEKRPDFLFWAWDQIQGGLYETEEETRNVKDLATGKMMAKTFKVIKRDKKGDPIRQKNPLEGTGITLANFDIKVFKYGEKVKKQISAQQEAYMGIATARAEALKADQQVKQKEAEGKKNVMEAKYAEEQVKVKAIVQAERDKAVAVIAAQKKVDVATKEKEEALVRANKERDVAEIGKVAAGFTKEKHILLGQGEAERKRLAMAADGALKQKLGAIIEIQRVWAEAYAKRQVPNFVMGGNGQGSTDTQTVGFMELLKAKLAKDLSLDMEIPQGKDKEEKRE